MEEVEVHHDGDAEQEVGVQRGAFEELIDGLLVIPDDWEPSVYPLQYADDNTIPYDANVISLEDWERVMEPHGMVFLPAGGTVKHREPFWDITGHWGGYWSASRGYPWLCYLIRFGDDFVWGDEIWYPHARQAVRVVREVRRKKLQAHAFVFQPQHEKLVTSHIDPFVHSDEILVQQAFEG